MCQKQFIQPNGSFNESNLEESQDFSEHLGQTHPSSIWVQLKVFINIRPYTTSVVHIAHTSQKRPSWLGLTGLQHVAQEYIQGYVPHDHRAGFLSYI